MEKKRSVGVTLFAWLSIFGSISGLLNVLTLRNRLDIWQLKHIILPKNYFYVTLFYNIIISIVLLIIGFGLLKLLKWPRLLMIITPILYYIFSIIFYLVYTRPYLVPYWIKTGKQELVWGCNFMQGLGLLSNIITIYFFTHPKVKEQFRQP